MKDMSLEQVRVEIRIVVERQGGRKGRRGSEEGRVEMEKVAGVR